MSQCVATGSSQLAQRSINSLNIQKAAPHKLTDELSLEKISKDQNERETNCTHLLQKHHRTEQNTENKEVESKHPHFTVR